MIGSTQISGGKCYFHCHMNPASNKVSNLSLFRREIKEYKQYFQVEEKSIKRT